MKTWETDRYPLSPLQKGMLFHSLTAAGTDVYTARVSTRLGADLDVRAFEQAWRKVIARHAVLRTSFHWEGLAEPEQRVWDEVPFEWAEDESRTGFDLGAAALMRFHLRRLEDGYEFVWVHHHILMDGRSRVILLDEVSRYYDACRRNARLELPEPPSFAEYVQWLAAQDLRQAEAFWRRQLETFRTPAVLAGRDLAPAGPERFGTRRIALSEELRTRLKSAARQHNATVNLVTQAAWAVLLSSRTGQDDIAFGVTRACRSAGFPDAGSLAGVLMNTLPVRVAAGPSRTWMELIGELRSFHQEVRQFELSPLAQIRDWSGLPKGEPLFDTMVVFEDDDLDRALRKRGAGLWSGGIRRSVHTHYPLTLGGYNHPALSLELDYDRTRFDEQTVNAIEQQLIHLLESVVDRPDRALGAISLLAPAERELLAEWSAGVTDSSDTVCLHESISRQARLAPDRIAVVGGSETLTYGELERRSNQLARRLRDLGVTTESVVGLCLRPCAAMLTGILGILKAGAAYLPLDPDYPADRLSFMLEDARAKALLTDGNLAGSLPFAERQTLLLDRDWTAIAQCSHDPLPPIATSRNLAYVIYTSGSTGQPKGVQCEHRGVVRLLEDFSQRQPIPAGGRCSLWTSPSFDVSVYEIFSALLAGGTLHLTPEEIRGDGPEMCRWLSRVGIQSAYLPPWMVSILTAWAEREGILQLKRLLVGVEPIEERLLGQLARLVPGLKIINGYGPTEATICATLYNIEGEAPAGQPAPIGRPSAQMRVFVLDQHGRPAPVGVPGELFLGGDGLARGYRHQPTLTAGRFVPDASSGQPGEQLYRTGDLVRFRPSGDLEFLGRIDHQLKIRGHRIEPREIESVLEQEQVRRAVVVAREFGPGDKRLVAYVEGTGVETTRLREAIRRRLPDYMMPSAFVTLEALPLTPNGKIDRQALPAPAAQESSDAGSPRTPAEDLLAGVMADVLGVPRVSPHDNFFALGGHSLLAMQVVSRARQAFGNRLTLASLFENPTPALLARSIEFQWDGSVRSETPVPQLSGDGPRPLSFAQQRLFFLSRLDPGNWDYHIPVVLRLTGDLDKNALEQALREIVRRHQALRTTFGIADGRPVQAVAPWESWRLDLREPVPGASEDEIENICAAEARHPFDLAEGRLLRATLLEFDPQHHALLIVVHHIASDAWSLDLMAAELAALYGAFLEGRPSPLAEPVLQYADYAAWQRHWLEAGEADRQLEYWRRQLAGIPPLPLPRPPASSAGSAGSQYHFVIPGELARRLRALSQSESATLFMTLLAGFAALLQRYTGERDLAIGTPISGRHRTELEPLIGLFLNILVLRIDAGDDPTFRQLLQRVRHASLDAYARQDVPFEKLVEELQPERASGETPFCNVMFVAQPQRQAQWSLPGLEVAGRPVETGSAKFDLAWLLQETQDGWAGTIQFRQGVFDPEQIARLAECYVRMLESAALNPESRTADLQFLSTAERHRILAEWSGARQERSRTGTILARIEEQAAIRPDSIAVVSGREQISYAELNRRANCLAEDLRRQRVIPDSLVAVCLPQSIGMVTAQLAVWKAGAAYVPIDPAEPTERVRQMLAEAGVKLILDAHTTWGGRLNDSDLPTALSHASKREWSRLRLDAELAYAIYTSGSTGTPKAVGVTFGALGNLVDWHCAAYGVTSADRASKLAHVGFDASVWEIWPYLANGAAVEIAGEDARRDPRALGDWLREKRATIAFLPTPLAELAIHGGHLQGTALRALLTGGDTLHPIGSEQLRCALYNHYGPTENAVVTTAGRVLGSHEPPPIGVPIQGSEVYVLDANRQPVGVGMPGELYIGGEGLARGYLGNPGLTAERFVPDSISGSPGRRLYRTGDEVRWRETGELEFLGRHDGQIKIRGLRIELGEVEAALARCSGVRHAAIAVKEGPGGKRLVGYVVASGGSPDQWRRELQKYLPAYMTPAAFVRLESIPLTRRGKVDRDGLPDPEPAAESLHEAPWTAAEELLAGIWSEVLGVERIGRDDHFFELGGHSLMALQVVTRAQQVLNVELSLRDVFEYPRLRDLADAAGRAQTGKATAAIPRAARTSRRRLSYGEQRLYFLQRLNPTSWDYHIPLAIRLRGPLDLAALRQAMGDLVRRHAILRTNYVAAGDEVEAVVREWEEPWFDVADVSHLAPEPRAAAVEEIGAGEARRPFELERGPLMRNAIVRVAKDEHVWFMTVHHIVSDGWSLSLLAREAGTCYAARVEGREPILEPLELNYADYAEWESGRQVEWERQLAYWKQQLAGASGDLGLPKRSAPAGERRGGKKNFQLDRAAVKALRELGRQEGATLFMLVTAGFAALIRRYSGAGEVLLGTVVAGRRRRELEGVTGYLANTVALRIRMQGDPPFRELLRRVKETGIQAYGQQEAPFDQVVEAVHPEREWGRNPLVQALVTAQNGPRIEWNLAGVEAHEEETAIDSAKFDVTVIVREEPDGGLKGGIRFRGDLYDDAMMDRLAAHLKRLLESAPREADRHISEMERLSAEEQQRILYDWNETRRDFGDASVVELFEKQVALDGERAALAYAGDEITYAELDRRANRLAGWLRSLGVGLETRVCLFCRRNPHLIVSVLGVLKAGGTYVPMDPGFPADRLTHILEDTQPAAILTESALEHLLPKMRIPRLALDQNVWPDVACPEAAPASRPVPPQAAAYIIYTSGSTGRPKGVVIEHRQIRNYMHAVSAVAGFAQPARFAMVQPLAVDSSATVLYASLCQGGCLHLIPEHVATDPAAYSAYSAQHQIDVLKIAPSHLAALESGADPHKLLPRRQLLVGGEASRREWLEQVRQKARGCAVFNHYGPTETTVGVLMHPFDGSAFDEDSLTVPLGRPIANVRAYVLDPHGQPVPIGVRGELHLGGALVGRGYLGQPALTAERFVPDPFGGEPGGRLYRTGDVVTLRADGAIEYLGRADGQVKIRGYRVELGEIEAVLARQDGVRQCAVACHDDGRGGQLLTGYVIWRDGAAQDFGRLQDALKNALPEHMTPKVWVRLDQLPLSAHGKVNRQALPAPTAGAWEPATRYAAPGTPAEQLLAAIWSEVLGADRIGTHDNFFELGGHSLSAIRVISRIRRILGVEVPLHALFQSPTIAGLWSAIVACEAVPGHAAKIAEDTLEAAAAG